MANKPGSNPKNEIEIPRGLAEKIESILEVQEGIEKAHDLKDHALYLKDEIVHAKDVGVFGFRLFKAILGKRKAKR